MIAIEGAVPWLLTAAELEERTATCPRCQDPVFLAFPAAEDAKVMCSCGFVANVADIANMPADLVEEARVEDLEQDVREAALFLWTESQDPELSRLGEKILDATEDHDLLALARLQDQITRAQMPAAGFCQSVVGPAISALLSTRAP